jgi:hypothetical protein
MPSYVRLTANRMCLLTDASVEVFTAVTFQVEAFWVVTTCSVVVGSSMDL